MAITSLFGIDPMKPDIEKGADGEESEDVIALGVKRLTRTLSMRFNRKHEKTIPTRIRRDIRSRKGHVFEINEKKIFKATQHHVEYTYSGTTLSGLAKLDDCTDYGVSEAHEKQLLDLEVHRLVEVVKKDGPYMFCSGALLSETTRSTFEDVSKIGDQIFCNLEIIRHDNARVSLEHCPESAEQALGRFKRSRRLLISRFKQDQTRVKGAVPKLLEPPERNQKLYFALVDYIIGSVGRILVRTATSDYWTQQTLSVLAQWATKLKVLSHNPERFANFSLDNGESVIEQMNAGFATKQAFFLKVRLGPDTADQKDMDVLGTESDVSSRYYREKTYFRANLLHLLKFTLDSLLNPLDTRTPASCFETCTMVYQTGLDSALTALSNDRSGQISASSDAFRVKCAYTAMELALRNLKDLASQPMPTTHAPACDENSSTEIKWEWSVGPKPEESDRAKLDLTQMDHLISAIVPLDLASAWVASELDQLVTLAGSGTDEEDPIIQFDRPPKAFQAWFTISTADWLQRDRLLRHGKFRDQDLQPVSGSPMRLGIRAGTNMNKMLASGELSPNLLTESRALKVREGYQKAKYRMDRWVVAAESITIECRCYVRVVIAFALSIICGGMAIPFAVGTRIRGVDPFQITTFAWVLAGFIAIMAKSRYVSEWPWHDFLRGHVICRSVKDVCDVTGIDSQMVLMYLLLEERVNTLRTKGPYNGMFSRKAQDASGFAIDQAVRLSTMLASGFILLKVLNEHGEHLICLDVRKGSKGSGVLKGETVSYLSCMDIGKDSEYDIPDVAAQQGDNNGTAVDMDGVVKSEVLYGEAELDKVKKLTENMFRWNKILGLYVRDSRFG